MKQYSFFSYASNEALHLSTEERIILQDYMEKVVRELQHPIDKFSKSLIISNIEVLLNYCMRFYERQFITREDMNHDALARFERLLDDYLYSDTAAREGVYPTENDCRCQRADARPGRNNQADCWIAGIPASAAFCPLLQTSGRVYTERVQE